MRRVKPAGAPANAEAGGSSPEGADGADGGSRFQPSQGSVQKGNPAIQFQPATTAWCEYILLFLGASRVRNAFARRLCYSPSQN